jgi:type I restriction enzyme S subunit
MKFTAYVCFNEAFLDEPVRHKKVKQRDYAARGDFPIVDQGQKPIAGFTNRKDFVKRDLPYIAFGDHTRVVKYVDFPFVVGADGLRLFRAAPDFQPEFLYFWLRGTELPDDGYGRHSKYLSSLKVPLLPKPDQCDIVRTIKQKFILVDRSRQALKGQLEELKTLSNAITFSTVNAGQKNNGLLGNVLEEIKSGIGEGWRSYPILGATRAGLAPAKERPGKNPERYKPVFPGTVFYNPMRILIGSIAFVDDDDKPGITSPDYVALKGKPGIVDSRWFYHWLRSPLGEQCINSLARGAVRERMLFNRLAEGEIDLPDFTVQQKASKALAKIKPMRTAIEKQMQELDLIPQKVLAQVFEG